MSDLTDEAKAEIAAAVRILREDGVHIGKYLERMKAKEPTSDPSKPPTNDPKPPTGDPKPPTDDPTPPPPNPPVDPTPTTKKVGLWPVGNADD